MQENISIEIYQQDWMPGFAAFLDDGAMKETAKAHVAINIGAIMSAYKLGDIEASEIPYFVAESLMHEVIHALEAWAGVEFSEERVETLLEKYNQKYGG